VGVPVEAATTRVRARCADEAALRPRRSWSSEFVDHRMVRPGSGEEDTASVVAARAAFKTGGPTRREALQHRVPRRVDADESWHGNTGGVERASLVPLATANRRARAPGRITTPRASSTEI